MNKKILLSTLAGGIVIFLLGGFFYGFLLADFFSNSIPEEFRGVNKENPELLLIICSDLIYAFMLSIIYAKYANIQSFAKGATLGAFFGFIIMLHFALIFSATTVITTLQSSAADIAISTVMSTIGGGIIGMVLGKLKD